MASTWDSLWQFTDQVTTAYRTAAIQAQQERALRYQQWFANLEYLQRNPGRTQPVYPEAMRYPEGI